MLLDQESLSCGQCQLGHPIRFFRCLHGIQAFKLHHLKIGKIAPALEADYIVAIDIPVLMQPEVDTSIIDAYNPACVLADVEPVQSRQPISGNGWARPYPNKKEPTTYGKDQLVR